MKIFAATIAALAAPFVNGVHQSGDIYYHKKKVLGPSMWHFSSDGLTIYSPDGSETLKAHPKKSVCKPYTSWRGGVSEDCYFFTMASDGHKYVWAGTLAGQQRVEAFDIDTGEYAGYHPTCSTPLDLEYHASRREMWLRCAAAGGNEGEIDVFSSEALGADYEHISLNETRRPYGRLAIHSTMGTYGFIAAYDQNDIIEIDLSSRTVHNRTEVPNVQGFYDMTYSPVNRHVYMRSRVCCGCGFEGASYPKCGSRISKVDIKTGPNAGMMQVNGTCGSGCEGSLADTVGVVEFDTLNRKVVGSHNIKDGTGFGSDPVASPDGKYILLLANDGGKYVRLIMPGKNGELSKVTHDIPTDFQGGTAGRSVVSDFAFVQDEDRNILILGASTDNNVTIVDLDDPNFRMRKMVVTNEVESTGGSSRKLEWAVGTNYVWVSGGATKQQYVLEVPDADIDNVRLLRTLNGVTSGNMIFVNNYERERIAAMIKDSMPEVSTPDDVKDTVDVKEKTEVEELKEKLEEKETLLAAKQQESDTATDSDDKDTDVVSVAALIISCVALLMAIVLGGVQYAASKPKGSEDGTQSLGSKNIE